MVAAGLDIFMSNNFYIQYFDIINFSKLQNRKKYQGVYYEKHHIIPKSLGGSNNPSNLVLLTPEEHYLCHSLLPRFLRGAAKYKMLCAWQWMNHEDVSSGFEINGEDLLGETQYGALKREHSRMHSKRMSGENHPHYGLFGENSWSFGKIHSSYTRQKMSDAWSPERRDVQSSIMSGENNPRYGRNKDTDNGMFGKTHSDETKLIQSESKINKVSVKDKDGTFLSVSKDDPRYLSGELVGVNLGIKRPKSQILSQKETWKNKPLERCPHYGKEGKQNMKRYHFDNCKQKV